MSLAAPVQQPVEAPLVGPLELFFDRGPARGWVKVRSTAAGVGISTAASQGSIVVEGAATGAGTTA